MGKEKKNNGTLKKKDRKLRGKQELPKISKRRKKNDPITIINRLHNSTISLKISASPEDWKLLEKHIFSSKKYGINYFPSAFYGSFVYPVMDLFPEKEVGSHGTVLPLSDYKSKNSQPFVHDMKIQIGLLWAFFFYWFKRSNKNWPEILRTFKFKEEDKEWLYNKTGKPNPNFFSAYCIQKVFGDLLLRQSNIAIKRHRRCLDV